MEKLNIGMSKEQVVKILGTSYTISEKFIVANETIEVISYRNFPYDNEFYLFQFKNGELEKWSRKLQPEYEERSIR